MQVREFLLRLALCQGISPISKYRLWEQARQQRCFTDIGPLLTNRISLQARTALQANWGSPDLDAAVALNRPHDYLTIADDNYPELLRELFCPPLVLFYRGDLGLLRYPTIGIVGARAISAYGTRIVRGFVPPLVKKRLAIVSGLAQGVDGLSHQVTLECGGMPIGVIGCGLDRYYPANHHSLQEQVAHRGLLLSEYGFGSSPLAKHFPERNRIIAGLSQVLLVVEARRRSGSLITANLALDENRTVCAVPGPIDTTNSRGCNELIAAGAKPILCAQDLLEEFK